MKRLSLLLVILLIAFAGCKKDKVNQDAIDNKIILAYLAANNITTAQSTGSGLYYIIENPGGTTHPIYSSTVELFYRGYLLVDNQKGLQFDSSYELSEQPAQLAVSGTIPGFSEGLKLFGKGGKGTLIIPSSLGYGSVVSGKIPVNSVLIFDIEIANYQ